ncbi:MULTISPECIES: MerR family transcriptional regulator [unclassified Clostridium]|uniref:MerR family transcriptional regulator n=1 Tax=unclassified Clostridium TaxID=2614128 RepID=UPI0018987639|nr:MULTISPECIES: MerR family transcriptional regulator [unclassified Clostridium]MCR1952044.1 MerR family transcriptional regulator [Clostridium sp. DSM 100503]
MEYTIKKLAELAGVSTRTLRYYDEIGLLKPCRVNSSGYRIYAQKEVDLLQQILLYRSLDMKLEDIQEIITNPDFDICQSLIEHHQRLISRRNQLDQLILTVEKTLEYNKGEIEMSNKEKFEGFKKEKLQENESKYGKEIREKYGSEIVEESNKKFMNMTEENFKKMQSIENEMFEDLLEVLNTGDLDSEKAKSVYEKHKAWLSFSWSSYSKEAHIGLAEMYVADERFAKYYNDRAGREVVTTLRDIIVKYAR